MSISPIITGGFGSFGGINYVPTLGFLPAAAEQDNGLLGGGAYVHPYTKYREEESKRRRLERVERNLVSAEADRKKQLAKAEKLKTDKALAKLAAEEKRTLDEINRLRMERAWLMRMLDDEEAMLAIMLSLPFVA